MASMDNLKRQHLEIINLVSDAQKLLKGSDLENNAIELSRYIKTLSGKLKIHLSTEDKFLYPDMLKSMEVEVVKIAKDYISEMGNLFEVFMEFKEKYNTKNKILNNKVEFIKTASGVLSSVNNRILKEDRQLYPLLK